MNRSSSILAEIPLLQQASRDKCFHPGGVFTEFKSEEVEQSIPDRFAPLAAKHADRIAVKTKNHTLTYGELDRVSNRIGRAISTRCGEDDKPLAVLLESDAPMIAAMLGILKAGKIYVPLDPLLPTMRAAYILEDSQAGLIVTNTRNSALAGELAGNAAPLLNIDELDAGASHEPPGLFLSPDTPAWILYTSGSTGQPKGVVQNHRNVLHFVMNYTNGLRLCPEDRLTVLSSFSANAANHDIFTGLLNGASLYPLNIKELGLSPLSAWLIEHEITVYHSVPTVFRHFLEAVSEEKKFPSVRVIRFGGEPASKRDVELYKKFFARDCILLNRMGSTETGTLCWYFIDKETQINGNLVPIGYAAEDNEITVLDDAGKEVEVESSGEIAVRSRYLTPGYWRKPELTAAAFLPDPEAGDKRIYRTGDVGRMSADGCLAYLGRKDFQVKIRGHRIEVAEIEMALIEHPEIKEAVVVAGKDKTGDQQLVAYLLPALRPAPTASEARRFLAERLPDYMIPSAWVFLDAFPLAPNGKVNRNALPPPSAARPELDTAFVAPRTPVEATLATIWSEVLDLDRVGIHDNFFDLGGHSLAATRVVSRVIPAFRIELPITSLFDSPTVADMAAVITESQARKVDEEELAQMLAEVERFREEEASAPAAGKAKSKTEK
jgi:amino acid adenylation domain-containing protein